MKENNVEQIKIMSIRVPKDLWRFLKIMSHENEMPMNEIIVSLISNFKKKAKEKLTRFDIAV